MADTLEIFGTEYTNVAGIKATDNNSQIKTYIRPQGNKSITSNGTDIDVTSYATVSVNVSGGGSPVIQELVITPTTSQQVFDGTQILFSQAHRGSAGTATLSSQLVIGCTYSYDYYYSHGENGDTIYHKTGTVTITGETQTIEQGYLQITNTTATFLSDNWELQVVEFFIEPVDGYLPVTVNAISPIRSQSDLSTSGRTVTVPSGYYSSQVTGSIDSGSVTAPSTIFGNLATLTTGTSTLTLTKTVSVAPNVTTAGYISSGTAGDCSISLTANATIDPTPTASGATVTIPAGYYSSQTTKSVSNGSATGPSSLSGSSATVTTGTNTITLTKTGVSTTPTVSAGYISSATSSTATVALTASVTTKAAATYNTSSSDQTIASGTYLTGTQTIKAVTVSGLSADKILSGTTVKVGDANDDDRIASVSGSVTLTTVYTGSSAPSSALGSNNDIYIQS